MFANRNDDMHQNFFFSKRISQLVFGVSCLSFIAAESAPFDAVYSFGDSLTDAGTFEQFVDSLFTGLESAGRFTVNPGFTYSMDLAEKFGLQNTPNEYNNGIANETFLGGTNYSEGAAGVVAVYPTFFTAFDVYPHSLSQQVSSFLADQGGSVNPRSLITLLCGDNDIQFGFPSFLPSEGYVASQGAIMGDLVQQLRSAGAQKMVVLLAANPATTPKAYGQTTLQGQLTELTRAFNQALLAGLEGSNAIVIDPNVIFEGVLANPVRFGFAPINQLNSYAAQYATGVPFDTIPTNSEGISIFLVEGQNLFVDGNQFVFADIAHPTPRMHQILGDTIYSVLRAPGFMAAIPNIALANSMQFMHSLESKIYAAQDLNCSKDNACLSQFSVYADYEFQDTHLQEVGFFGTAGSGLMNGALVGGHYFFSPSFLVGAAFNYQNTLGKVNPSRGSFRLNQYSLNVYTQGAFDCNWIGYAALSGGYLGCHSERQDQVGIVTLRANGDINGQFWAGEAGVRYQLQTGKWTTGPQLSYLYDYVRTNSFTETGDFTALRYGAMHIATSRLNLGWDTEYGKTCDRFRPFLQLAYEWSLGGDHFWVDYGMVNYSQALVNNQFSDSFNANAGVKCKINDLLDAYVQGGFSWFWTTAYIGSFNVGIQAKW